MSDEDLLGALLSADRDVDERFSPRHASGSVQPCPLARHWIEVVLFDQGAPVEGARCRVTLPDGGSREGVTNARGRLRVEGIATAGECAVSFPDVDEEGDDGADDEGGEGACYTPGQAARAATDATHLYHLPAWELAVLTIQGHAGAPAPPSAEAAAQREDDDAPRIEDDWEVEAIEDVERQAAAVA